MTTAALSIQRCNRLVHFSLRSVSRCGSLLTSCITSPSIPLLKKKLKKLSDLPPKERLAFCGQLVRLNKSDPAHTMRPPKPSDKEDGDLPAHSLLLVSLGPIQDFIQSARKCQDLWFGSWMLSDLARATAQAFQELAPQDAPLIFPGDITPRPDETRSVANKILAIFPTSAGSPKEIAEKGRQAMLNRLRTLGEIAYNQIRLPNYLNRKAAFLQLDDLMEYLWVAVPMKERCDYAKAREDAEILLAQRKATRDWGAVPWTEEAGLGVPKSSLDGLRESVIYEALYEKLLKLEEKGQNNQAAQLRSAFLLKGMERLCGIGLLKRIGSAPDDWVSLSKEEDQASEESETIEQVEQIEAKETAPPRNEFFKKIEGPHPTFHSTSHVAAAPLLTRLAKKEGRDSDILHRYLNKLAQKGVRLRRHRISTGDSPNAQITDLLDPACFSPNTSSEEIKADRAFLQHTIQTNSKPYARGYDGTFLFESRVEEMLEESGVYAEPEEIKQLRRACTEMLQQIGISEPTPYYAFLLADGDRMGAALDALAPKDAAQGDPDATIQAHRKISEALVAFNNESREIVAQDGGSLIYAGGDDVLALVPLHTALQCAYRLQRAFLEKTKNCFPSVDDSTFKKPTLSVGLGIAHHMEPMSDARALAGKAERLAKNNGRNSLGIVISKRSGGRDLEAVGKWDESHPLHQRIAKWARLLHQGILPHGAAFKLEDAVKIWEIDSPQPQDAQDEAQIAKAIESLALRVIAQSRSQQGSKALQEEAKTALHDYLANHSAHAATATSPKKAMLERIRKLSSEIQIARLFLKARNDAFDLSKNQDDKTQEAS